MPYTANVEDRIIHVVWTGVISDADLQQVEQTIPRISEERRRPMNVLHTFDAVTGRTFESKAAYAVALKRREHTIPAPVRAAVVVSTPDERHMADLFVALNRSPDLNIASFDSEKVARAWLAQS